MMGIFGDRTVGLLPCAMSGGKIILGIDPGTQVMGYGLIEVNGSAMKMLQYGVLHLSKYANHQLKLKKIFEKMLQLIDEYLPDEMAVEAPFYGKNVQSMLKLGRAQGVAIVVALSREIPVVEYAPRKIKQSVTGSGSASKEQVAAMLEHLLHFKHEGPLLDATDALAAAVCHHYQTQNGLPAINGKASDWTAFLRDNPHRAR